jgi:hypothetical protein
MADLRTSSLGGVPKGTTDDRPASPSIGDVFYNGTLGCLEIYTGQGWVANSAPPGIPTIGTVTYSATNKAYNNSSASVAFTPGEGGGLPNLYRATSTPGGFSGTATSSPITVEGLQSATAYTFSVTGTNNFGTSAGSFNSNSITANTVPEAPTIVNVRPRNSEASVSITSNATGGSTITGYTVTSSPGNITAAGSSSPIMVTGLTNGTSYTFTAVATNANGNSLASVASNSVTPLSSIQVDYLVVAGGGSGGGAGAGHSGGGGGAGGYRTSISSTPLSLNFNTNYTVTVGAGGSSKTTNGQGNAGSDSVFSTITSAGGGGGGIGNINGGNGGSGGGAGAEGTGSIPGTASPSGQGNNGGIGFDGVSVFTVSGGGGGAGQVGGAATPRNNSAVGGLGGNGLQNSISGTSVFYAGGGGGGNDGAPPTHVGIPAVGGSGGGGTGGKASSNQATTGTANTGGGGGGASSNTLPFSTGAAGGSGVVLIRIQNLAISTTGSPLITTSGSDTIYQFNNSGSITF